MKTFLIFLGVISGLNSYGASQHASFRNSDSCYLYATFVRGGAVVAGGYCVAPSNAVVVTYNYQAGAEYFWIVEPAHDGGCVNRFDHFISPNVDADIDNWTMGTCTNAFIPPGCDCYAVLNAHQSPAQGAPNAQPHNLISEPNCDSYTITKHSSAPQYIYTNATTYPMPDSGTMTLTVRNAELVAILWPHCCVTSWGIAFDGNMYCYTNGVLRSVEPITLSVPNSLGVLPCPQHGTTNSPSPRNYLMPPRSALNYGTLITNALTGYDGGEWEANIICGDPPVWSFVEVQMFSCNRPTVVMNYGPFKDPMQAIYDMNRDIRGSLLPPCSFWPFSSHCTIQQFTNLDAWIDWTAIRNEIHHP